jgi:ribosome-associated heat shock protein Hsp15
VPYRGTLVAMEVARVDRWLWAVRAVPTRASSTALCRAGHVKVNGKAAKASTTVHAGDSVTARIGDRERVLEVVRAIGKRVGAPLAAGCVLDHSPSPEPRSETVPVLAREDHAGRPTKKDRRQIDRLRGR